MNLAIKYRPKTWGDLVGQGYPARVISAMITTRKQHPFYVFGGERGTGKTTTARILAKALNCVNRDPRDPNPCLECELCKAIAEESCPDVVELDAATNGGIASVRRLKDLAMYRPMQAKYRVIILDEAHAMSREAFQAMLKILEEPPEFMVFVMATTEVHQIPDTIMSRAFPFEFRKIPQAEIQARLMYICSLEGIDAEEAVLAKIAARASGGMRDAITMLEQLSSISMVISESLMNEISGGLDKSEVLDLFRAIAYGEKAKVLLWSHKVQSKGIEPVEVQTQLLAGVRDLMAASVGYKGDLTTAEMTRAREILSQMGQPRLSQIADEMLMLVGRSARSSVPTALLTDLTLTRIIMQPG